MFAQQKKILGQNYVEALINCNLSDFCTNVYASHLLVLLSQSTYIFFVYAFCVFFSVCFIALCHQIMEK